MNLFIYYVFIYLFYILLQFPSLLSSQYLHPSSLCSHPQSLLLHSYLGKGTSSMDINKT